MGHNNTLLLIIYLSWWTFICGVAWNETMSVGSFTVTWGINQTFISISHSDDIDHILFQSISSGPFISIGFATDSQLPIVDGNSKLDEWTLFETPHQSILNVTKISENEMIMIGEVWGMVVRAKYEMKFYVPTISIVTNLTEKSHHHLAFDIKITLTEGRFNRVFLNYRCDSDEKFYGFGAQYSYWNLKGRRVPILVSEQGIGRGAEPITSFLNYLADGAGGDWSTTYAPKPIYVTNYNRSMIIENSEITFFDLRDDDAVTIEVWGTDLRGRVLYGPTLLSIITEITKYTGRMPAPPQWTQTGAVIGLEDGTDAVLDLVSRMEANPVRIPISAVWLQDWVGLRHAYDGDRLRWNWQLDHNHYPRWNDMLCDLASKNIRILTYINPFFTDTDEDARRINDVPPVTSTSSVNVSTTASAPTCKDNVCPIESDTYALSSETSKLLTRNLYQEGIANGYFLQSATQGVGAYKLRSGSIDFCMVDVTNPYAREWIKEVIKNDMVRGTGSAGYMADFGEYLPFNAVLYNSSIKASEFHNRYPEEWARINYEVMLEVKAEKLRSKGLREKCPGYSVGAANNGDDNKGEGDENDDIMYFMRAAWSQSPSVTSMFWLGDQMVSFEAHDGLQSVLVGALSSGLGGHSMTHSDIGGYTMQEKGPFPYIRTKELLLRWMEFAAFGSALYRTHVGLSTSIINSQVYEDHVTMTHFAQFAQIYAHLSEYRKILIHEATTLGWPLIRPMMAYFAYDPIAVDVVTQYMFGDQFLVAPVIEPAVRTTTSESKPIVYNKNSTYFNNMPVSSVKVYLPAHSQWIHVWSGQRVEGGVKGRYVSVDAPFGAIPVFYRVDEGGRHSEEGVRLRNYIMSLGMNVNTYCNELLTTSDGRCEGDELSTVLDDSSEMTTTTARMRLISDFVVRDWYDWLGIKQYVSKFV